jgi:hypothetical protein
MLARFRLFIEYWNIEICLQNDVPADVPGDDGSAVTKLQESRAGKGTSLAVQGALLSINAFDTIGASRSIVMASLKKADSELGKRFPRRSG